MTKSELIDNIYTILEDIDNEDEMQELLKEAMEYFCGARDKCEAYKYGILLTLKDQANNHIEDLTEEDLIKLTNILEATNNSIAR